MLQKSSSLWLNLLYQQSLFTLADTDYGNRVNFTLRMRAEQREQAESWLTDAMQKQTELTEAGFEYEEVPVGKERVEQ